MKPEKLKQLMSVDMELFGKVVFEHYFSLPTPMFHKEIYHALEDQSIKRLAVIAPRGYGKSTIDTLVYPAHRVLFCPKKEKRYIRIISETENQGKKFLRRLKREFESNEMILDLWGDMRSSPWGSTDLLFNNQTRIAVSGTGQAIKGDVYDEVRPTDVIMDDFESEDNCNTPTAIDDNKAWARGVVEYALDRKRGRLVLVGTLVDEDTYLATRKDHKEWKVMFYQGITPEGKALWPEHKSLKEIEAEKRSHNEDGTIRTWSINEMNQPVRAEERLTGVQYHTGEFDPDTSVLTWEDRVIPLNVFAGTDPASTRTKKSSNTAHVVFGMDSDENIYTLMEFKGFQMPDSTIDMIFNTQTAYNPIIQASEKVGYQTAIKSIADRDKIRRNIFPNVIMNGVGIETKDSRLMSLQPLFVREKIYIRPSHTALDKDIRAFPKGKKDVLDALWHGMQVAFPPAEQPMSVEEWNNKQEEKKKTRKRALPKNWKTAFCV